MANMAYLIKTAGKSSEELFEANNTIPLFWFNLLDLDSIINIEKELIESHSNEDEEYATIKLNKKTFIGNLNSGKKFIEKNYFEKINLYNDFMNYLDNVFNENDILELNILEIANFSDAENLIKDIKNIINNVKTNSNALVPFEPNESMFSFIGYDGFFGNEFCNYSSEYSEYCQSEKKKNTEKLEKEKLKEKIYATKENTSNILLIVFGVALIGLSVIGIILAIKKSVDYFPGIIGILFGLVSAGVGILKVKKII